MLLMSERERSLSLIVFVEGRGAKDRRQNPGDRIQNPAPNAFGAGSQKGVLNF
jgi:hypothetical protein